MEGRIQDQHEARWHPIWFLPVSKNMKGQLGAEDHIDPNGQRRPSGEPKASSLSDASAVAVSVALKTVLG